MIVNKYISKSLKFCLALFSTATSLQAQNKENITLPEPYATKSVQNFCKVIGWKEGELPIAPKGFTVSKFAGELENPRWLYVAPNGDVFVAEAGTRIPKKKGKTRRMSFLNPNPRILAVLTALPFLGIKIKMVFMKVNIPI